MGNFNLHYEHLKTRSFLSIKWDSLHIFVNKIQDFPKNFLCHCFHFLDFRFLVLTKLNSTYKKTELLHYLTKISANNYKALILTKKNTSHF